MFNLIIETLTRNADTTLKYVATPEPGITIRIGGRKEGMLFSFTPQQLDDMFDIQIGTLVYEYITKHNISDFTLLPSIIKYVKLPWYKKLITHIQSL
jgi:hypothetical protein